MQNADLKMKLRSIVDALGEVSVKGYRNRVVLATCEQDLMMLLSELDSEAETGKE